VAINHSEDAVTIDVPGTDILTGASGAGLRLEAQGVALVAEG
jgi:beta-galactosidase